MSWLTERGYLHAMCMQCWHKLGEPDTMVGGQIASLLGCCFCGRSKVTTWRTKVHPENYLVCQGVHVEDVEEPLATWERELLEGGA